MVYSRSFTVAVRFLKGLLWLTVASLLLMVGGIVLFDASLPGKIMAIWLSLMVFLILLMIGIVIGLSVWGAIKNRQTVNHTITDRPTETDLVKKLAVVSAVALLFPVISFLELSGMPGINTDIGGYIGLLAISFPALIIVSYLSLIYIFGTKAELYKKLICLSVLVALLACNAAMLLA